MSLAVAQMAGRMLLRLGTTNKKGSHATISAGTPRLGVSWDWSLEQSQRAYC
jgi:hypothetical protein